MSDGFIEWDILCREGIEYFGMESGLKPYIHRIVDDDNPKSQADHKLITPDSILDADSGRKAHNQSRVSWWHTPTSKRSRKTKSSVRSMYHPLYYDGYKKGEKWNS